MKAVLLSMVLSASLAITASTGMAAPKSSEANSLARKGTEAVRNGEWEEGIQDLRKATEMDHKYASSLVAALLGRAATRASQQQFQEAATDYDEVLKLDSRNITALEGRASMAMKANDMDKALAMYSDAIKAEPKEIKFLQYRSYIYEVKGDLKNSMADTEKILKLDKSNADALARKERLEKRKAMEAANGGAPPANP